MPELPENCASAGSDSTPSDYAAARRRDPCYGHRTGGVQANFAESGEDLRKASEALEANAEVVRGALGALGRLKDALGVAADTHDRVARLHARCPTLSSRMALRRMEDHIEGLERCAASVARDLAQASASAAAAKKKLEALRPEHAARAAQTFTDRAYAGTSAGEIAWKGAIDLLVGASLLPFVLGILGLETPTHLPDTGARTAGEILSVVAEVGVAAARPLQAGLTRSRDACRVAPADVTPPSGSQRSRAIEDAGAGKRTGGTGRQTGGRAGEYSSPDDAWAAKRYDEIRGDPRDVDRIADATGLRRENIEKVKRHVFEDTHVKDRFVDQGVPPEIGRFDPDPEQVRIWERLQGGRHTQDDIAWIKHEIAERKQMELSGSRSYGSAHDTVKGRWPSPLEK